MMPIIFFGILLLITTSATINPARHSVSSCSNSSCTTHQIAVPCLPSHKHSGLKFMKTIQICPVRKQLSFNASSVLHEKLRKKFSPNHLNAGSNPQLKLNDVQGNFHPIKPRCLNNSTHSTSSNSMKQKQHPNSLNTTKSDWEMTAVKCLTNQTPDSPTPIIHGKTNSTKLNSSYDCRNMSQEITVSNDLPKGFKTAKILHKKGRLHRREAIKRKHGKAAVSTDKSDIVSGLFPSVYFDKNSDNLQAALQKYLDFRSVVSKLASQASVKVESDNDFSNDINIKGQSSEPLEIIDDDIEQVLDLIDQYMILEQTNKDDKVNTSLHRGKQRTLNMVHGGDNKVMMRGDQRKVREPFKHVSDESIVRDKASEICKYSHEREILLRALSEPESSKYWSASCLTGQGDEEAYTRIMAKKSTEPLLENSETQSIVYREVESCSHHIETKIIALPGCVPKSVLVTRCHGQCSSRSVPKWSLNEQEVQQIEHCTCCSPFVIKSRTLRFLCPRRPEGALAFTLGFPFRCACRPCTSTPDLTAEQPYDY